MRLFDACVTTTMLYGCSTWSLTHCMQKQIQAARRKMLRYVFRIHRRCSEDWVEYMQRSARRIEIMTDELDSPDWVETLLRRKWRFAGRLATHVDNRWSKLILDWKPNHGIGRCRGHPCTRWVDPIESFAGGEWQSIATQLDRWEALEEGFVSFLLMQTS